MGGKNEDMLAMTYYQTIPEHLKSKLHLYTQNIVSKGNLISTYCEECPLNGKLKSFCTDFLSNKGNTQRQPFKYKSSQRFRHNVGCLKCLFLADLAQLQL